MKKCSYCGRQNEDAAVSCRECGVQEFGDKPAASIPSPSAASESAVTPATVVADQQGPVTTLKCRTPGEAYLVVEELEAADIIAILPDEESMMRGYRRNGYVGVQVSSQSYQAASELQFVIDRRHWELRAQCRLSTGMKALVLGLALVFVAGWVMFLVVWQSYKRRGYESRAEESARWFIGGLVLWLISFICLVVLMA